MKKTLTAEDLKNIQSSIRVVVRDEIRKEIGPLLENYSRLQSSLDRYLKRTEDWHHEFQVLQAQHNHLRQVLIKKGVATDKELSLTGS